MYIQFMMHGQKNIKLYWDLSMYAAFTDLILKKA